MTFYHVHTLSGVCLSGSVYIYNLLERSISYFLGKIHQSSLMYGLKTARRLICAYVVKLENSSVARSRHVVLYYHLCPLPLCKCSDTSHCSNQQAMESISMAIKNSYACSRWMGPLVWHHWYGMFTTSNVILAISECTMEHHSLLMASLLITSHDAYSTDFISNISLSLLNQREKDQPFFMYIAPYAPHAPAMPAHRHQHLFPNITAPRNPSFNPSDTVQHQKVSWIKQLHPLNNYDQISNFDSFYRNRLRSLQAVDEMLENITLFLPEEGLENNTCIFYMSDIGEHLGDFRMPGGKRQGYDTDVRVPLFVRGPGIKGGMKVSEVVMSVDLYPHGWNWQ